MRNNARTISANSILRSADSMYSIRATCDADKARLRKYVNLYDTLLRNYIIRNFVSLKVDSSEKRIRLTPIDLHIKYEILYKYLYKSAGIYFAFVLSYFNLKNRELKSLYRFSTDGSAKFSNSVLSASIVICLSRNCISMARNINISLIRSAWTVSRRQ